MAARGSSARGGGSGAGRKAGAASGRKPTVSLGRKPASASSGRKPAASSGGRKSSSSKASGSRQFSSHGAGRTGAIRRPGEAPAKSEKGLGGEQIEGRQAVRELLIAGKRRVREIWVSADPSESEVVGDIVQIARNERVQVIEISRRKLDAAARSEAPQGIIAFAAPLPEADFAEMIKRRPGKAPFIVAVDGVTDPGNLGALLRCCDGAGVDGVVLPRHRAVHVTPTVAKSAAGAVEHVPIAVVGGLPQALARMKELGIWVIGLDDAADRELFDIGDLAAEGVCLVLGAEGPGLSRLVRERCDMIVSIPMRGRVSSLNVSAAAALACYEITRARR